MSRNSQEGIKVFDYAPCASTMREDVLRGLCTDPNVVSCSAAACAVGSCTQKPVYQDYGFLNGPIPVDITGGTILVSGSKNGTLYALNESDGSIAWTNAVVPLPVTPDLRASGSSTGPSPLPMGASTQR